MLPRLLFLAATVIVATIFLAPHCPEYPGCGHGGACPGDQGSNICIEHPVTGQVTCGGSSGGGGGGGGGFPTPTPTPLGTPPKNTVSKYVSTVNSTKSYESGCLAGIKHENAMIGGGLMVLHFGAPRSINGVNGTTIHDDTSASIAQINSAMRYYILGYKDCNNNPDHHIRIGVGTSSHVDSPNAALTYAHGAEWALMVNDLDAFVIANGWGQKISIYGAIDIEVGSPGTTEWGDVTTTRSWVNGYDSTNNRFYYNFGDAGGCPSVTTYNGESNANCDNSWTIDDIYYVSWGNPAAAALPEIYTRDDSPALNGVQWKNIRLRSKIHWVNPLFITGTLTQWQACQDRPAENCSAKKTDNRPHEGWLQLFNALAADPLTIQSTLPYSSDIAWED